MGSPKREIETLGRLAYIRETEILWRTLVVDTFKDILPSITQTGKPVILNDNMAREYTPWLINRALAHYPDSIMQANEMNIHSEMPPKLQYDYLLNTVRKYKRQHRWYKRPEVSPELELIMEYYGCSEKRAKEMIQLLTRDQLEIIRKRLDKGGIKDEKHRSPA